MLEIPNEAEKVIALFFSEKIIVFKKSKTLGRNMELDQ